MAVLAVAVLAVAAPAVPAGAAPVPRAAAAPLAALGPQGLRPGAAFGTAVGIGGNVVVVGKPFPDGGQAGKPGP
ncbi:MAG TPA: hypothetical protein VMF65_05685 [Acidimicrobiales bacterium]|nr:hypothetical protein [Acidimicrobiales bacterium]